jgi:small membrane protein
MIIKVVLIAAIAIGAMWLLRGQRRAGRLALTRMAGLGLAASWIVAVVWPDAVTGLAQVVGVGRGTDLVLYATVVAFMFSTVLNQRRFAELDERITALARASAIQQQQLERADARDDLVA